MITVGIVTRNRPEVLRKCLASLALIGDLLAEVIVVDDTSDTPAADAIGELPPVAFVKPHARATSSLAIGRCAKRRPSTSC